VYAILSKDIEFYNKEFNDALKSQNIELLENTPIGINVYGVSGSTKGTDNYVRLNARKISSISIPYIYNRFDEIHVNIEEASDGDYYYIDPEMGPGYSSFVDYIETMGEDIRAYMIMHELSLKESWVDNDGKLQTEITHKEYHIIDINEDDEDDEISKRFDAKIKYRPICMYGGLNYVATIIDTIKIINTVDSSSYEVTGSLDITNPHKYGKKIKALGLKNDSRPIINVYNKNTSSTRNGSSSVPGYGVTSGSKTIGSLTGSFSLSGTGGSGGTGGDNTGGTGGVINGSYSGDISGLGNMIGNISGSMSESGSLSGNISGTLPDSGGFISGTFSNSITGTISGTISGYIPGIGYITGTISGSFSNGSDGSITGTITSTNSNSNSNINSSNGSNSDSGGVIVLNKGGGYVVENLTQNITSFIESTNVCVKVVEISPDDIN
jgi:hypothetical protein